MESQGIFRERYVEKLLKNLKSGTSIDFYKSVEFVYDAKEVMRVPGLRRPEKLLDNLDEDDNYTSAIAVYEAYKDLSLVQASDTRLWTYLTHVDFYPYMIEKWDKVYLGEADKPIDYIEDHWFLKSPAQNNLMRHPIAGFWWSVKLSIDEERKDKYELTRILFKNETLRTRTFGTYKLARHKEASIGLLEFFLENEDRISNFEKKHQDFTEYLNLIGGVKPLAFYKRDFFKAELERIADKIL